MRYMIFVRIRQHFLALIGVSLNVRACNEPHQIQHQNEKKALEETQKLCAGCKAEPKFFAPLQTPFPGRMTAEI